jgi:hypothetical protein
MEDIIKYIASSAILIGAITWLSKHIFKSLLDKDIEKYKNDLNNKSINYREKIDLYKEVSKPIINLIITIEHNQKQISKDLIMSFEKDRLFISTQLAMFAPTKVFDSYNELIDYIYNSLENKEEYTFEQLRNISMKLLTDIRKDIGIYKDKIKYNGNR